MEDWALLDRDHSSSLLGATEALKASTLRLPVVGKTVVRVFILCFILLESSNSINFALKTVILYLISPPSVLKADIQNLKDAVGSAVDVMQAMASSICSLSVKVISLFFFLFTLHPLCCPCAVAISYSCYLSYHEYLTDLSFFFFCWKT